MSKFVKGDLFIKVCVIDDGVDIAPFITAINGGCTISNLDEIEQQMKDDEYEQPGDYVYSVHYEPAQTGFEGRTEVAAYWDLTQVEYSPF